MTLGSVDSSDKRGGGGVLQDGKGVTGRGVQLFHFPKWRLVVE